ncbi:aliphatic sulfonate ABC transporter substrate-binding protein [Brachybacterium sp. DNPG3]
MSISRRTLLGGLAAAPALTALAACGSDSTGGSDGSDASSTVEVTIGYIPEYNGASLFAIAEDQGFWEENGVAVTLQSFTNGPLQVQALGTGDIDFGYIGPGAMWLPASGKATVVTINSVGKADRVIAQSGITSIEDLKGKTVGVPEGTSGDMILQLALKQAGMSIDDVERVAMDPTTVVSAFASGQIDAAGIWYPLIDTIAEQVPDLVELAENADFADVMQFPNAIVSSTTFPTENEDATLKVLTALRAAMDFRAADQDAAVEITAAFTDGDAEAMASDAQYADYPSSADVDALIADGTLETWLQSMNDFFAENGKIEGDPVAPADYLTSELFTRAGE